MSQAQIETVHTASGFRWGVFMEADYSLFSPVFTDRSHHGTPSFISSFLKGVSLRGKLRISLYLFSFNYCVCKHAVALRGHKRECDAIELELQGL